MEAVKRIALVAHDNCKRDLVEWVNWNWTILLKHSLICTGTTGRMVDEALQKNAGEKHRVKQKMVKLKSGPFGATNSLVQ